MASEAQIKANRMNAQKSTGPRSAEGKEAVSQNATKHGLCSSKNVIKTESQGQYNLFHDEMIEDLAPAGAMELVLAERIVNLSWRLKRAEVFQNVLMDALMDFGMNDMVFGWADKGLKRAREQAQSGNIETILGIVVHEDFANANILEKVLVYEKRIESSLYKATAELRKLQKMRMKETAWAEAHPTDAVDEGRERIDEGGIVREDGREMNDKLNNSGFVPRELRRDEHPTSSFGLRRDKQTQFNMGDKGIGSQELMDSELKSSVIPRETSGLVLEDLDGQQGDIQVMDRVINIKKE